MSERNVNTFKGCQCASYVPFSNRDYYKITLCKNRVKLTYSEKIININRPAIIFTEPNTPYAWESFEKMDNSYRCVFNETFAQKNNRKLLSFSVFQAGKQKVIFPDEQQLPKLENYFKEIRDTLAEDYEFAEDKVHALIELIIYEILPKCPEVIDSKRIKKDVVSTKFFKLIENQFHLLDYDNPLLLKAASDYSSALAVHPNHLNKVLKKATGKTTTALISEQMVEKANEFLNHSDWSISQISYALGFETPSYFNQFYKKQTGHTPGEVRTKND